MTARPILFSAPMVKALIEGRKTQTRRIYKPQPVESGTGIFDFHGVGGGIIGAEADSVAAWMCDVAPYEAGDLLWVREAWQSATAYDDLQPSEMGGGARSPRRSAEGVRPWLISRRTRS